MSALDFLLASQAWAAAAEAEHEALSITQILFPLGNFIIFAWILKRFALPLIRDFLRSRHDEIVNSIQTAAETRQRAAATVENYKARLARLDQEVQSIQSSLRAEGERDKSRLLEEAEALARKISEDARFLADQEVKIARQKIREEIATQAESAARELIQRNFTPADQSHLTEEFISDIGQSR